MVSFHMPLSELPTTRTLTTPLVSQPIPLTPAADHMTSALIFGLSAAGRWYAPKLGVTRAPYTLSMVMVPIFYFLTINLKEKRFPYDNSARRTLE